MLDKIRNPTVSGKASLVLYEKDMSIVPCRS